MAKDAGSTAPSPQQAERLRRLPSVEALASALGAGTRPLATRAAREVIGDARERILLSEDPPADLLATARARLVELEQPSLRRVVNATGVIVHTNLGRAPLSRGAATQAVVAGGYTNLELDLESGERRSRQHHVEPRLCALTGAEAALAVNNCAGALLLACSAFARGREVVVSRGQLVEIGGSFRIPDVAAQSGARLVEVGTTNRTRLSDYERALGPDTAALLRVHQSNFRTVGFVEQVGIEKLCELGERHGVPVIDDVGSGAIGPGVPELADEPRVTSSVAAGAAVTCFSGDKLLGGPQAGLMVGRREAIESCRGHPLARALRIDKLTLAALEDTLVAHETHGGRGVPVLEMLTATEPELAARAEAMREGLAAQGVEVRVMRASARAGGGTLPEVELEGPVCAVEPAPLALDELMRRLRGGRRPVVGRAHEGWLLLDPRTMTDEDAAVAVAEIAAAVGP